MSRHSFLIAFGLGALAVLWVAAAVASSHFLVLVMTAVIGAVYVFAALELRHYRDATRALNQALSDIPADLQNLSDWLITLPASLQNAVRQRIEGERQGLPGPALTPYLVGLLVMLGMLGTFLGMVVTLNGAVFALEGSSNVAGIRAAFSEPIKGLGLAFGTSVAGVATSAMLGLMSSLARRERAQASQTLDSCITSSLRGFSLTHQRQETFKALQQQSQALPQVVTQLQAMMVQMAQTSEQINERLMANQKSFHQEVHTAYTGLAQSVDQSLRTSLSQSMQVASDGIRPVVQATMTQMAEQAQHMNQQLLQNTQQQLAELNAQFSATAAGVAQTYSTALAQHETSSTGMLERVGQTLDGFSQTFAQRSQSLLAQMQTAQAEQQSQQGSADQQRLEAWKASLEQMAASLSSQWQASGSQTLAQQQAICDTLAQTAQAITTHTQTQATQTLAEVTRLMASSEELMRARIDSEAQWAAQHTQRSEELSALLRTELSALREAEDARGQAAVARLSELQTTVTAHLSTLGTALEDPITRLIETASQAPKAAAEVIGQLRQEISVSVARDNALLEERTRILDTLSHLLDAINHASTEQRSVIDNLVSSSAATLNQANSQFIAHVSSESAKLGDIAAQVTASAVDVASLGETFAFAVRSFNESNEKLMGNLQRIEQAIDKSMTRSDEQLAYYVAQAREIIDLSITSQKDVLETLQARAAQAHEGAA
ncbi:hypothetical protein B9Z52_01925 [Limnohabitans sp. Jir72]|nr:hypothetical protein B9Z52_01925 [Limnohabitans sp. Jir72]